MRLGADAARPLLAVGAMSGTSLDGVTVALVRVAEPAPGDFGVALVGHATSPYTVEQRARLAAAVQGAGGSRDLALLHADLGRWIADAVLALVQATGHRPSDLSFVASHGQTVWHEPRRATLQIGNPAEIAERVGVPVISDFRSRDVAAGGEGAPLVPRVDRLLFAAADAPRVLLNIGGIANFTVVPKRGVEDRLLAFDTGPGVMVIDACVRQLFPGRSYDEGGAIARRGRVIEEVLAESLGHEFFAAPPPKSTGREVFGDAYARAFAARCLERGAEPEDVVATAVELTARTIGGAARFIPAPLRPADVVRSGGGARNPALVEALERAWPGVTHRAFDDLFFDGDAKEAVAFAFLAYLTWTGRSGNEPGATGAAGPRVLGTVTPP